MSRSVDCRRTRPTPRRQRRSVELPAEIFDVQANIALIHQVVVAQLAAARQGTHSTKTRGEVARWRQEAVPAEGHRPRPAGLDPRTAVRRRWHRPRPAAAQLRPAHAEEDEGRRPAWRTVRPGAQRPRARRVVARRGRHAVDEDRGRRPWPRSPSRGTSSSSPSEPTSSPGRACATSRRVHLLEPGQLNTYDVLISDDVVFTRGRAATFVGGPLPSTPVSPMPVTSATTRPPVSDADAVDTADEAAAAEGALDENSAVDEVAPPASEETSAVSDDDAVKEEDG